MIKHVKSIIKKIVPEKILSSIYSIKPSIQATNTYLLKKDKPIENLYPIDKKYIIRILNIDDKEELRRFYSQSRSFDKLILPRLKTTAWIGLAVIDTTKNTFAYVSWIIMESTEFIKDFKINLNKNQYFLRHGYCSPQYRHQRLHTRMEQERINYCIHNGANEIFIQIGNRNEKGKASVKNNGFMFLQKNYILRIPALGIYRELFSALKSPYRRVI